MQPDIACLRLETFIAKHLPLISAMSLSIETYNDTVFEVSAPLAKNHNDKLTAFGGSLYNLCITNAIGLCFLKCYQQQILEPDLVVSKADIRYLKPVASPKLLACCEIPAAQQWQQFFADYQQAGKASINLSSKVMVDGAIAAEFNGRFAIIGQDQTRNLGS